MYALNPAPPPPPMHLPRHHHHHGGQPPVYLPPTSNTFSLFPQSQPQPSFLHFYPQSFMFMPPPPQSQSQPQQQQQSQFGSFAGFTFNSPPPPPPPSSSSSSLFATPTSVPNRKPRRAKPDVLLRASSPPLELESHPLLPPPTIHSWQYSSDRIGEYDIPSRVARLERYQAKRRELKFRKVRYAARSEICSQRKRVGGRFVTAVAAASAAPDEDKTTSDEEVSLILQGMKAHA